MIKAKVQLTEELDNFVGHIRDEKGFNTKNEALSFIIREYKSFNGELESLRKELKEERKTKTIKPKTLPKKKEEVDDVQEIKRVVNGI